MRKFKEFLKNRVQEASKNQKGFSLVELIIVIAILGIIAAIALPNVTRSLNNSRIQADITNAKAIANAVAILEAEGTNRSAIPADSKFYKLTQAIANELNGAAPSPKVVSGKEFLVSINSSTKAITIGVGTGATDVDSKDPGVSDTGDNIIQVYPAPEGSWIIGS